MDSDESSHDDRDDHDDSDQGVGPQESPLPMVDTGLDYQDSWLTRDQIMAAEIDCHYQPSTAVCVQQLQLSTDCSTACSQH